MLQGLGIREGGALGVAQAGEGGGGGGASSTGDHIQAYLSADQTGINAADVVVAFDLAKGTPQGLSVAAGVFSGFEAGKVYLAMASLQADGSATRTPFTFYDRTNSAKIGSPGIPTAPSLSSTSGYPAVAFALIFGSETSQVDLRTGAAPLTGTISLESGNGWGEFTTTAVIIEFTGGAAAAAAAFGGKDETLGIGNDLIFDDDGDTYIYANQDDRLKFFTAGVERFEVFGANIDIANNVDLRPATNGGTDLGSTARRFGGLYIDQGGPVSLDDDGDTKLWAPADDTARLEAGSSTSYIQIAGGAMSVVIGNGTHFAVNSNGATVRDAITPAVTNEDATLGTASAGRAFAAAYLGDRGEYLAAISEVQPTTPNDGHVLFSATDSAGVRELWALDDGGTATKIL